MTTTPGLVYYNITSQWDSGFTTSFHFTPADDIAGWQVEITFAGDIVNIWNAQVLSRNGDTYRLGNTDHNGSLAAGQSVAFGFQATGSDTAIEVGGGAVVAPPEPAEPPTFVVTNASVEEGDPGDPGAAPASLMGPLTTSGNTIRNGAGEVVQIEAVNWFGMETTTFAPHGLWTRNWKEMMDEMKALGFNAIRLPFSLEAVLDPSATPNGIDASENPDLVGLSALEILDRIVAYAEEIELPILLDNHRSAAGNGPNPNGLWHDGGYTEADWIEAWTRLAERYGDSPAIIGADLANEPHGATWEAWAGAAERAGEAILSVTDAWLIVVEGVGSHNGDNYWWGGNLQGVAERPVVLSVDDRLVYSPHDYPASVYPQPWFFDGSDLNEVFRSHWGFIHEEGIAPVLVGEMGSRLETDIDRAWAEAIVAYLAGDHDGDGEIDPGSTPMSFAWWSWNPNSGDTGGVLADDWRTVRPEVTSLLEPLLDPAAAGEGGSAMTFTVALEEAAATPQTVDYWTADGSAEAGSDYVATAGSLVFAPGETERQIVVPILGDLLAEDDETFVLHLLGPAGTAEATGTIFDDDGGSDAEPTLTVADVAVSEGAGRAVLTLQLSAPATHAVEVSLTTEDGTAHAGEDYRTASGTVVFAPGETTKRVSTAILDDATHEPVESFAVRLTANGAQLANPTAAVTILDDDSAPPPPPPSGEAVVSGAVVNDWGSGAQLVVRIHNDGTSTIEGWQLSFAVPAPVDQLWGGTVIASDGLDLTVENMTWNARIAPDETVEIGLLVTDGGIDAEAWLGQADFELLV